MSRIKDGNYYVVQSFMVKDLGLKGLEKDIYAIIYGFSQAEDQKFDGSLQYLADWTNCTKQGVLKTLNSLLDKGLLKKDDIVKNGVKFCQYFCLTPLNSVEYPVKQSLIPTIKQSLTNNILINKKEDNIIYCQIIDYLNEKAGTSYRANSKSTQSHINARLSEKYTLDDFKKVIDNKVAEWKGTEFEQYLRPATLFGTKFESYLNAKVNKQLDKKPNARNYDKKFLNNLFDDLDNIEI